MIIAIDIGGTKTLVALATNDGKIKNKVKFLSVKDYKDYIKLLGNYVTCLAKNDKIDIVAIGCPGLVDRDKGLLKRIPNLGWSDKPLAKDIAKLVDRSTKIIIENDANLAGLSEAHLLNKINQKVMYITFSTGIGTGFIDNGILVPELLDSEGGHMVFEHEGQIMDWESFAAGRAIVKKYGKMAADLDDSRAWADIAQNMAIGIVDSCAIFPADTVIIGGGVGTYYAKYAKHLDDAIEQLIKKTSMIKMPAVIGAKDAEGAVVHGCIILAKQYHEQC
jgi:predicted NBD/HSP70 family sugar kinase